MEICNNLKTDQVFIHLDSQDIGQALMTTPKGVVKALEYDLFTEPIENVEHNIDQASYLEDRRKRDRRHDLCEGFAYITMVGWICRREKIRRKDDSGICKTWR